MHAVRKWSRRSCGCLVVALTVAAATVGVPDDAAAQPRIDRACPDGHYPRDAYADLNGNTHTKAISCAGWWDITHGTSTSPYPLYSPRQAVTRGQMASLVMRLLRANGTSVPKASHQGFDDVSGHTHADAVNRLARLGLVRGDGSGRYRPDQPVRRAQMATFLVGAHEFATGSELPTSGVSFSDIADSLHRRNIVKAARAGLVAGRTGSRFAPNDPMRRDQLGSFLARSLDRLVVHGDAGRPARAPNPKRDYAVWDDLAGCESDERWSISTGNGYYGGLQFSLSSWRAVGGSSYPHHHDRAEQIRRGQRLQERQGWGAWPACSRKLGLN